jgi:hypothetical protein
MAKSYRCENKFIDDEGREHPCNRRDGRFCKGCSEKIQMDNYFIASDGWDPKLAHLFTYVFITMTAPSFGKIRKDGAPVDLLTYRIVEQII